MNDSTPDIPPHKRCPICGEVNNCQIDENSPEPLECWCTHDLFVSELRDLVPEKMRNKACVCRRCTLKVKRQVLRQFPAPPVEAGDFYNEGGNIVFTAQYLKKRGYCCGSDCRHCPYDEFERKMARTA